jgi:hypothetical protein
MSTTVPSIRPRGAWDPTPAEVAAIVREMRPIIDRLVERDARWLHTAA